MLKKIEIDWNLAGRFGSVVHLPSDDLRQVLGGDRRRGDIGAGAAAAKSSEDAPAASAILSGIAARAQLPQNAADIAPKEPQTPPAPAQGGDNITIDPLMRYD